MRIQGSKHFRKSYDFSQNLLMGIQGSRDPSLLERGMIFYRACRWGSKDPGILERGMIFTGLVYGDPRIQGSRQFIKSYDFSQDL